MYNITKKGFEKLISDYVQGNISVDIFEKEYINLFRKLRDSDASLQDEVEEIISILFTDIDCFCGDPELREEEDIDEQELLKRATSAFERLKNLGT